MRYLAPTVHFRSLRLWRRRSSLFFGACFVACRSCSRAFNPLRARCGWRYCPACWLRIGGPTAVTSAPCLSRYAPCPLRDVVRLSSTVSDAAWEDFEAARAKTMPRRAA
jgi:hypothetical protein